MDRETDTAEADLSERDAAIRSAQREAELEAALDELEHEVRSARRLLRDVARRPSEAPRG